VQKLEALKEKQYANNLKQLLDMGCSNFEVNLNLLKRNGNDLVAAVNKLCNGQVTESMFELV
jgi:hypothetical protein